VEYHLVHDGWTPEGIAGRLPLDFPGLNTNYESIEAVPKLQFLEQFPWIYWKNRAGH
jgi:hypothetical protein